MGVSERREKRKPHKGPLDTLTLPPPPGGQWEIRAVTQLSPFLVLLHALMGPLDLFGATTLLTLTAARQRLAPLHYEILQFPLEEVDEFFGGL